jgi:hypothetical protein
VTGWTHQSKSVTTLKSQIDCTYCRPGGPSGVFFDARVIRGISIKIEWLPKALQVFLGMHPQDFLFRGESRL